MADKIADELRARLRDEWLRKATSSFTCQECGIQANFIDEIIKALDAKEAGGWQPIETAPDFERVIVAGWQPKSGTVAGYWWMHEDDIVAGRPPSALLWHPFPNSPPAPPSRLLNKEDRNG